MLTVAKITGPAALGYGDYLDGKTQEPELGDYYLKDGERTETPGRWAQGAELFGLDGTQQVTSEQLHTLMAVQRPDTGAELRAVGGSGDAVAAIDATFSAPKSVSAVWALGDRELRDRIEQAHETAVDRALIYAIGQVRMIRRRVDRGSVVHEKAAGLVATSWRHTTARAVDGQVPDPQLHSHILLHAAVRGDGRLVAIDSRSWLVHQREVGAAYRSELARELDGLGFALVRGTGRGARYFELDAIPQSLLDRWSSRHHQVQAAIRQRVTDKQRALKAVAAQGGPEASEAREQLELLARNGQLSPKQDRLIVTATRNSKALVTVKDLDSEWRRAALPLGVSRERIEVLRRQRHPALEPAGAGEVLEALTEFDAKFAAREARAVALERSVGTPIEESLDQLRQLRSAGDILVLTDGTGTTLEHRVRERTVVAITGRLAATRTEPIALEVVAREVVRLDRELSSTGGRLSEEQRAAIELACADRQMVVIEGQAGTGKSTTLAAVARAHQASGREIMVTSTAALAAERLATELDERGINCTAISTAGLHAAINTGRVQLTAATTVIHDEAALASTREQLRLLRAVEQTGARLIAVGDPRQNQPVGAAGLWTQIEHASRSADAHVELTINQRARDPYDRRDQARFREGQFELAVQGYDQRDRIHLHPDQQRIEDEALDAAHADRAGGWTTIVIAQTSNEHLDQLNARAQAIRQQHGELGDDSLEVPGRPYQLRAGDLVQVRHTMQHPEVGQLRNGTMARVTQIDPASRELGLELVDGTRLRLSEPHVTQADVRLAYVQHPFPAQGQTVDSAHVIVGNHATREGTYVAITRAREQTHIYAADPPDSPPDADRLQSLAEQISHDEPQVPSIGTPLSHESAITTNVDQASSHTPEPGSVEVGQERKQRRFPERRIDPAPDPARPIRKANDELGADDDGTIEQRKADTANEHQHDRAAGRDVSRETDQRPARVWPRRERHDPPGHEHLGDPLERDRTPGWGWEP